MAQEKYTEATTFVTLMQSELQALANNAAVLDTDEVSNDASTERDLYRMYQITIGAQTARTGGDNNRLSLLIVPYGTAGTAYTDAVAVTGATGNPASNFIAKDINGTDVTWIFDDATNGRTLTWPYPVLIPNANFKHGVWNRTTQALENSSTTNVLSATGTFSVTYL